MDDKEIRIPFVAFESTTTRFERINKRLWILSLILTILLFATNLGWVMYEKSFEAVKTTVEQEIETGDNGGNTIVNGVGDIHYGESKAENN